MSKQKDWKTNEEFGSEFGDINAAKYYEILEATNKSKKKKQDKTKKQKDCP